MYRLIAFKTMKKVIFSLVLVAAIAVSAVFVKSCGNAQAQEGGNAKVERFEYQQIWAGASRSGWDSSCNYNNQGTHDNIARVLNQLGSEGWELVSTTSANGQGNTEGIIYTFKRKL